jgi:twitching motility protein PilT
MSTLSIVPVLQEVMRLGASDLHVVAGNPVMMRLKGELIPVPGMPILDNSTCSMMLLQLLNDDQKALFQKELTLNMTFGTDDVRYRMNLTLQRKGMEGVFRILTNHIPTPEELHLPQSVIKLTELDRGLVLVTGPTGTGKSTTLASLLDRINTIRHGKIITIEDPIEFVYTSKNCFVSQREVGEHTPSFALGMKDILRQDPDVVLVGELRDFDTMLTAIQIADTGHLVLATMHSSDAPQAIERYIDVFPHEQQQQIRAQLAANLKAVIAQALLPRLDGKGLVGAYEIMFNNAAISTMIRHNRAHEIAGAIDMSLAEGMKSMARAVNELIKAGVIDASFGPVNPSLPNRPNRPTK